jgi:hypothetical protein
MSFIRRHSQLLVVAASCAALGAGAGAIASAGAATTHSGTSAAKAAGRLGTLRRVARRAVDGDVVVHTQTGFGTVTFHRGTVTSVSGRQLALTEGTAKASYKTVTLTIPAGATVRDDGHKASLSDVTSHQRVLVLVAPHRTYVIARTPRAA